MWLMFGNWPAGFASKLTVYDWPSEIVTFPLLLLPAFTHTTAVPPVAEIVVPLHVIVTPLTTSEPDAVSNFVPPSGHSPAAKAVGAVAATAASITANKTKSLFIPSPLQFDFELRSPVGLPPQGCGRNRLEAHEFITFLLAQFNSPGVEIPKRVR
jgi:hypothetical protein